MSVIGKTFICGNCKTGVKLSSEGTSFKCPNCNTINTISSNPVQAVPVDKTKAAIDSVRLIMAIILIVVGLYYMFK